MDGLSQVVQRLVQQHGRSDTSLELAQHFRGNPRPLRIPEIGILLVLLRKLPDTLMHEAVGLLCLLLYVAVPGYFLMRLLHRLWPASKAVQQQQQQVKGKWAVMALAALTLLVLAHSSFTTTTTARVLQGEQMFYLLNVTSETPEQLQQAVQDLQQVRWVDELVR